MEKNSMVTEAVDENLVAKIRNADLSSRRSFLQRSAAAGAGALALAIGSSNTALAHDADDDDVSDVNVLNFALTLEHLEYAFYRDGLARFDEAAFEDATVLDGLGDRVVSDVRPNLKDVRDHEETHVDTLTSVIESLDGDPVEEACYEFGVEDVNGLLAVAAVLENTGVSAYAGAINLIESAGLLTAGATIATVEARHASYLNLLTDADPFPAAFDDPKSMQEILDAAGGFIVDCTFKVMVDCDVADPARVSVTNVADRALELRDLDSKGANAVMGRPVLDPGETHTMTGVSKSRIVLQAYDPESGDPVGPEMTTPIDCE